jgi:hypothetical protein
MDIAENRGIKHCRARRLKEGFVRDLREFMGESVLAGAPRKE